jgi:uncharacterized membrane protein YhhN
MAFTRRNEGLAYVAEESNPERAMSQPDRYADAEPLIPEWAAPIYLAVSALAAVFYLGLDLVFVSVPGMAISKTLGIALLAAYAAFSRAPLLALALILSACGDYALALTPPAREAGIAFFGSAHIVYILLFALAIHRFGWRNDGVVLMLALIAFGAAMFVWLRPGLGEMAAPVTAYLAVIVGMGALAAFVNGPRLITLGAVLFVVSDSLIAAGWFRGLAVDFGRFDLHGAAIWITYYLAQAGIAVGVVRMKAAAR